MVGIDSGTDSDTASSIGDTNYQAEVNVPAGSSNEYVAQHLFWMYQKAKGAWRQFMGKPVRKVRRFLKREPSKGKGKGKGKGFNAGAFLANMSDDEVDQVFAYKGKGKGKGKSKGKRSSGKGLGRKTNPKGPDGSIL